MRIKQRKYVMQGLPTYPLILSVEGLLSRQRQALKRDIREPLNDIKANG